MPGLVMFVLCMCWLIDLLRLIVLIALDEVTVVTAGYGSESNQSLLSSYPQAGPDAPFDRYVLTAPGLVNSSRFLSLGGSTVRYQQIDPTASRQDRPPYNGRMTAPNEPLPWFYMHT